jgi:phosphoribosylformylglycinamidine cyclo-ligase
VATVVDGVAAGCRLAGCALLGGETAEHPGIMGPDDLDLAATCVGVVEREDLLDGSAVAAGDLLVGLAASGLHSNGFSLVRRIVEEAGLDLEAPYGHVLARHAPGVAPEDGQADRPVADVLLAPTRIYARALLAIRAAVRAAGPGEPGEPDTPDGVGDPREPGVPRRPGRLDVHGIAHVTGGGLPGNVPRIVPDGLAARVHPERWAMPSVMRLLGALGGLADEELRATFNGGIGMVLAVPPGAESVVLATAAEEGIAGSLMGEVVPAAEAGGRRYVEVRG